MMKQFYGLDLFIEYWSAAAAVEWAAALRADVFPRRFGEYSEERHSEFLAGLYSAGAPKRSKAPGPGILEPLNVVAQEILSVDDAVPIVEFAKSFRGGEVDRFRALVSRIRAENATEEQVATAVSEFNAAVRHYAQRPDRVKNWELLGALQLASTVAATLVVPEAKATVFAVSLGALLLRVLVNAAVEDAGPKNAVLSGWVDTMNATLAGTSPDAVLVARMKKRLRTMT